MQQDSIDALLNALDPDPERAGIAYRHLHRRLTGFFRINSVSDPESLADEAIDRLARRIAAPDAGEIGSATAFVLGVARHLLQEDTRRKRREREAAAAWASLPPTVDEHHERLLQSIDHCLHAMRDEQRELLESYYRPNGRSKIEQHRQLAEKLGLTLNALRNRLMRARNELDRCVRSQCGDILAPNDTKR